AELVYEVQERWYLFPVPIFSLADRNFSAWLDKMDFRRIDYGLHLVQYNMRGRNETFKTNLQYGFNRKYEIFYTFPYISRRQKLGLSLGGSVYQSHFIDYKTVNDTLATFRDDDHFPIQRYYGVVTLLKRENVQKQVSAGLSFHYQSITDTVLDLNPNYFLYGKRRRFIQVELVRTLNFRNSFAYPLSGYFLQFGLVQQLFFNSTGNANTTARVTYSRYHTLPHHFYYSYSLEGQARLTNKIAYADNQALGYKSFVRGYQLYVVDGQYYGLFKQGFSKRVLNIPEIYIKFLPSEKFRRIPLAVYANVFADGAYVADRFYEESNDLSNHVLFGTGAGLHFVTYYDRVLTVEYAINREGEGRVFIQTKFPF
ncbi:MAG: hypothetical protein LPK19_14665, partial [Hymenobacteraceae bacterium]|nr:hypothetical protein [Hymenobacteraceae bacterium]MDX5397476.1 hypothetical protein [Hymenobacteraceae bacterium]MDX5513552.1 hypothetical protein [Hymenobacteraceae bacterium]